MRGIETLKRNRVEFNTLTTVHRANADSPLEVYRFLQGKRQRLHAVHPHRGADRAQVTEDGLRLISPDFAGAAKVAPWSVEPRQFGKFLCAIFDEWVRRDVGRTFVQLFDVSLESWSGMEASLCIFRKQCGSALAIEHSGDLYSCDHFVYPENRLGNILDAAMAALAGSAQQQKFGEAKESTLPRYCRECDVRFACNGECPKHRFLTTPDGEPGLNYLVCGLQDVLSPHRSVHALYGVRAGGRAASGQRDALGCRGGCARAAGENWPQRSMFLRQRTEIQTVLRSVGSHSLSFVLSRVSESRRGAPIRILSRNAEEQPRVLRLRLTHNARQTPLRMTIS